MFSKYKGALLVVSHDRNFLNHICNKIVEIEDGKIKIYKGNYDDYKMLKKENIKCEENEYKKYISEKKRLEQVISAKKVLRDRIKKAPKGMGKSEAKTIKMGDQRGKKNIENNIKSVEKRIEHMDVKKKPKRQQQIVININDGCEITAKNLIEIINYNLKVNNKILLENINLKIVNGVKAALIGENGCGKTSLLNRIMDFMQDKEVNGYSEALDILLTRYKNYIFNISYRFMHNYEDAMDLTQDVLIRVYKAIGRYEERNYFKGWLYRIISNTAINMYSKAYRRESPYLEKLEVVDDKRYNTEKEYERIYLQEKIYTASSKLKGKQRDVFILRYYENYSYKEIADILNMS